MATNLSFKLDHQLTRFLLVGGISTVLNYVVFLILYQLLDVDYAVSSVVGYFLGAVFGFVLNRSWSFQSFIRHRHLEVALYVSVYLVSLLLALLSLRILVIVGGLDPRIANILAIVVSTVVNFSGCKFIVFNQGFLSFLRGKSRGVRWHQIFTPMFFVILVLKLIVMYAVPSRIMEIWFLPFVDYFIKSGFENPYAHFFQLGEYEVFPYSSLMLWLFSVPVWLGRIILGQGGDAASLMSDLFLLKTPNLIADFLTYLSLCFLLPARTQRIRWLYWANPIVFYICYFHGQLDAIPTALFVIALCAIFVRRDCLGYVLFGLGLATKSHLAAALPFLLIYSWYRRVPIWKIFIYAGLSVGIYAILQMPYYGEGFRKLVLFEEKSQRLFALYYPFDAGRLKFLFAPCVLLLILYRFVSLRTSNRDTMMLVFGLLFGAMVTVVTPMPGWYFWSLPFFVYFFAKYPQAPVLSFGVAVISYGAFFLCRQDSDFIFNLSYVFPGLVSDYSLYDRISLLGVDPDLLVNLSFTALQASMLMNVLWIYREGISSLSLTKRFSSGFTIGVSGDSGAGKSTYTTSLQKLFGEKNCLNVAGDDLHKWERENEQWREVTHLDPRGNRLHDEVSSAKKLASGQIIERRPYDHSTGKFGSTQLLESNRFIIFQGLHSFYLKGMRGILDLKVFIDPAAELRYFWKISRDMSHRGYSKEQVLKQLERRESDSATYIEVQKKHADIIISFMPEDDSLSLDQMLEKKEFPIKMRIKMSNLISCDLLIMVLEEELGIRVRQWHDAPNEMIVMEFIGELNKDRIEDIAGQIIPRYFEVLDHFPDWEDGHSGMLQLITAYYLHQYMEAHRS